MTAPDTRADAKDHLSLLALALQAPLCAIDPDDTSTIHAATTDAIVAGWPDGPIPAPCGAPTRIIGGRNDDDRLTVTPWPPRVKAIAPTRRCLACHKATGSRSPAW